MDLVEQYFQQHEQYFSADEKGVILKQNNETYEIYGECGKKTAEYLIDIANLVDLTYRTVDLSVLYHYHEYSCVWTAFPMSESEFYISKIMHAGYNVDYYSEDNVFIKERG